MKDALQGVASRVRFLGSAVSLSLTGREGVGVRRWKRSKLWRHIGRRRVRVMKKLDQSKVERIIREKRKGGNNKAIAEEAGVSTPWLVTC